MTVRADISDDKHQRAIAYVGQCPAAVSHQGGHDQTFDVARAVVWGFDLGEDAGFDLLWQHYNPRCQPPWSEAELRHKCQQADTVPYDKPRGHLLNDAGHTASITAPRITEIETNGQEDIEALPMPPPSPWPALPEEALYGLVGEITQAIEPETESHPVAILGGLLAAVGNAVGRGPHFLVEGRPHHLNLFQVLVGKSAYGRKGTAQGRVEQAMEYADRDWCRNCQASGLSTGEGLAYAVRDKVIRSEPMKKGGRVVGYQDVEVDPGVADKRLLVVEPEFAQALRVMEREGNNLSPTIRQAWDTGNLRTLTKNNPTRATGAHISILGHITQVELLKLLKHTEAFNGFANRFLWLMVKRQRVLPDGGRALDLSALGARLNFAVVAARNVKQMHRTAAARRIWHEVYPQLTSERPGLYGAVTGRAEAQVLRLSMIYAVLDGMADIDEVHLQAALAFWAYADASARLVFGVEPEDPLLGLVQVKLKDAGADGMTRTDLHHAFNRNIPAAKLLDALAILRDRGEARSEKVKMGKPGAPAERWFASRPNELNELTPSPATTPAAEGINSLNSSAGGGSKNGSAGGEEVVIV
jgi:hypothetical protein